MKQQNIISNFSRSAQVYDRYASIQAVCAHHLLGYISRQNPKSILDLCCGTGTFTGLLVDKYPHARIKAVDISAAMIDVARTKLKNSTVDFAVADAQTIMSDCCYDMITANAGFQWFSRLPQALKQYHSLLHSSGELTFSLFGPKTFEHLQAALTQVFDENVKISAARFPLVSSVKESAQTVFDKVSVQKKIYTEIYGCVTDLLRKIKYSGVAGNGLGQKRIWTKGKLAELQKIYHNRFGKIIATYEVAFFRCTKK